jgi:hypothetical protein
MEHTDSYYREGQRKRPVKGVEMTLGYTYYIKQGRVYSAEIQTYEPIACVLPRSSKKQFNLEPQKIYTI